jgi:predicted metalloendopeptidase
MLPGLPAVPSAPLVPDALTGAGQITKVGYHTQQWDYSKLVIDRDDRYGNYRRGWSLRLRWPSWAARSTATSG